MSLYEFRESDTFINQLKTKPNNSFLIYDSEVIYNKNYKASGSFIDPVTFSSASEKNLYELNVDREEKIYPFVTKDSTRTFLSTISTDEFNSDFTYGDKITGSYPLTSSISRNYYAQGESRLHVDALKNTFNYYKKISPHYSFSSSLGDKSDQESTLISIPKIFYGDRIQKGSLKLDFRISGSLIGRLEDENNNGELIQTAPSGSNNSGSVAGVCLYNEGFIHLTGSWDLDTTARDYLDDNSNLVAPAWKYFGAGIENNFTSGIIPSSSFGLDFKGDHTIPTLTMLAKAPRGQLNYSQNPTFLKSGSGAEPLTSSKSYVEPQNREIKNVASKPYSDPDPTFEKITYINRVSIYDEDGNLLGIAKTSRPIKKKTNKSYTFKFKLDI